MLAHTRLTPHDAAHESAPESLDLMIGRRAASRHRLNVAARFLGGEANVRVQIEDVSASGASFRLIAPRALSAGRLCWLGFEVYGRIAWQTEDRCGFAFDEPLAPDCLRRTLEFADKAQRDHGGRYGRLASAWVHGPGDY